MSDIFRINVVSDIHYAGAAERARRGYETRQIGNPLLRLVAWLHYRFFWLHDPTAHHHRLDEFLAAAPAADLTVANGDFSCDSAFVGVSDDAACASAQECLQKLRGRFAPHFSATIGDHELGKFSMFGRLGGMRLASWRRTVEELGLRPFWRMEWDRYVIMGVTSSLIGYPVLETETRPEERAEWRRLREAHLNDVRGAFAALRPEQRLILFCHDPTALPILWREEIVRARAGQIERTLIGHLHTRLVLFEGRLLAGMPRIGFLGNMVRRNTASLNEARHWRHFKLLLCPSLTGIQLLKDGGYYTIHLERAGGAAPQFQFHPLPW